MPSQRRLGISASCLANWLAVLPVLLPLPVAAADLAELTQLFRAGKYAECVTGAAAEIENARYSENLRLLKLRAEMELGRYGDALKTLDAALKDFPTSIHLRWVGRSVCRLNQQPERSAAFETQIAALLKQSPWQYSDAVNQVVAGRFYLSQGVDPKVVLNSSYVEVRKRQPTYVDVYLAIGDL
ncbi:MAG TPA: hypothetical protein VFB80_06385, partial [Pirellulaceae bacterium]|nr:hypothetical protein [Pirellulaceae bacterium]